MEAFKLLLFVAFLSLIVTNVRVEADDSISDVDGEVKVTRTEGPDSSILEQLKSKILNLESHVEGQSKDIEDKNNVIAIKEKTIREKAERITSLESEMASLQRKGKTDAAAQLEKAHAKAAELEKQVEKLTKDIGVTIKEKELLEVRIVNAEKKLSEADSKSESLQKTIDDLKSKLRKTEQALQIAEEEMIKAKFEATSKVKELVEVHGAWLPPWLAVHCNNYQSLFEEKWKVHGKPALERLKQKATEKRASVKEWAAPHVDKKLVPVIKEQWEVVITKVEPHLQMVSRKTVDFYEVSKDTVTPHIIKAWELADPYFQELRKSSKPYIDQIATAFKPYTDEVVQASEKFLESATVYHRQVQEIVHAKLKSHELTEPLATKEFVWYSASILLALPILFLFKICFPTSCKKDTRPIRNANPRYSRRKGKRVHHDDARNEVVIGGMEDCVSAVEKILKYRFNNKKLLEEALTHPSCAESASYQRLEFFGDAALALAVSNFAYLQYPTADPGQLTDLRSANISNEKLARVAVRHELYKYVRRNAAALDDKVSEFVTAVQQEDLGEVYGGRIKARKVLADIVESIAAAVYIDCNFDLNALWRIFRDLLEPIAMLDELDQPVTMLIDSEDGAKQKLHDLCVKKKWRRPTYKIEREYGLSHEKKYVCSVEMDIMERKISVEGGEKFRVKEAENSAAFSMLHMLKDNGIVFDIIFSIKNNKYL